MKYGVISKADLVSDLKGWDWLYAAGRLHKPVQILKENPEIQTFMRTNYENAVKTALLLMPKTFTELDLFRGIASLSYIGDPRMIAGENPKKVTTCLVYSTLAFIYSNE
jgi:translocator assembly and maintenance protein 41